MGCANSVVYIVVIVGGFIIFGSLVFNGVYGGVADKTDLGNLW